MTQEEEQIMQQASAAMVDTPTPWASLTPLQQLIFRGLMPQPSFTPQQHEYISRWWLPLSNQQLSDINALCPADTRVEGREDGHGQLYVSCDLLSDALDGGRLWALLPLLETMPLTYLLPEAWPSL